MRNDELDDAMDRLLKDALSETPAPHLPAGFESRVLQRARGSRLTSTGRVTMALYVVLATAAAAWFMRDLPIAWIGAAIVMSLPVAAGASAYARRLVL